MRRSHPITGLAAAGFAIVAILPAHSQGLSSPGDPTAIFPEALAAGDPLRPGLEADADAAAPSDAAGAGEATGLGPDGLPLAGPVGGLRVTVIEGTADPAADAVAQPLRPQPAEEAPVLEFVADRRRAELEALGLRAGSFILYPQVVTLARTTDNVFAADMGKRSDVVFLTRPTLRAQSDWSRHELAFDYSGEYGAYRRFDSENPNATLLAMRGRLDVSEAVALNGSADFAIDQEGRSDIETPSSARSPTSRQRWGVGAGASRRFNRLTAALRGSYAHDDYSDGLDVSGATIDNSDRDRVDTAAGLRLSYEISPVTSIYTDGELGWRRHDRPIDDAGFARDADRQTVTLGAAFAPAPLLRGEVAVGYVHEDFADTRLAPVDELAFDASLAWAATPLTTLTLSYDTDVASTTLAGASASVSRTVGLAVDHELFRHAIIGATLAYETADYRGAPLEEDTFTAGLSGEYWVTRRAALIAGYDYSQKASNDGSGDIAENTVSVGLRLRP